MAWNDIDWLSVSRGGGFMENIRADEKQALARDELSTQQNQFQQKQAESKREFDVGAEERKREFDARLPLLQFQIKTQQDADYDRTMFPILWQQVMNGEISSDTAATKLRTVPARVNFQSVATQMESNKAFAQLGVILGGGADLSSPAGQAKVWGIMARHPEFGESGFKMVDSAINHAMMSKDRELSALGKARGPASVQEAAEAAKLKTEAADLRAAGDIPAAEAKEYMLSLIEGKMLGPTETIETTPEGVRIVKGGKAAASPEQPTQAFKTKLQEQLFNYNDAFQLLDHVQKNITAGDVGVRGIGKELVSRIGGQLGQSVNPDEMDVRKTLGLLKSSLTKSLRSDASIAEAERKQIQAMLPSLGPNESLPDAIASLNAVRRRLSEGAKSASSRLGVPQPSWSYSVEDVMLGARKAYQSKKWTEQQAIDAINKFQKTGEIPEFPK